MVGSLSFFKTADWISKRPSQRQSHGLGATSPVDPNASDGNGPVRIVNSVCLSCGTRMGARLMRPKEISLKRTRFAPTPHYLLEA